MKINVAKITKEGVHLVEDADASSLELNTPDLRFEGPLRLEFDARREGNDIFVSGDIKGNMALRCSRCLDEYKSDFEKTIFLQLPVPKEQVLYITDNVREEIILEYPVKPLCREDCKGLCARCGKNLNEGNCNCK